MQLSGKQKAFSQFLSAFFKYRLNFEHFQKKGLLHTWCFPDITDSEKRG